MCTIIAAGGVTVIWKGEEFAIDQARKYGHEGEAEVTTDPSVSELEERIERLIVETGSLQVRGLPGVLNLDL